MPEDSIVGEETALIVPARDPLQVFISYRTHPDSILASAVKRLIESSIEPTPLVFVAGDGGLRSSNAGFRQQLTEAARKSNAFVAVITNASKDREWIFFEAGAAWGRDLMYVPLLIGAQARDLPATIADYQAVKGDSKEDVQRLVVELAQLAGSQVKERFGQRFFYLARVIQEYLEGNLAAESKETVAGPSVVDAMELAANGFRDRATQAFDELEKNASESGDIERICSIKT